MLSATDRFYRMLLLALSCVPVALFFLFHPAEHVVPTPGFRDIAREAGLDFKMTFLPEEQGEKFKINLYDHGCGLVVGDFDCDGRDDILFLNQLGANALFRNIGDGRFADVTSDHPGVALADRVCVGGTFADYDNDGDQDLYITSTRGGNVLLQNTGAGRFKDVTAAAGVACVAHSQTAAFFDCENDGDLDLLVTNTAKWTTDVFDDISGYYLGPDVLWEHVNRPDELERNRFFRNNGDGTFTDATSDAGLAGQGWGGDVAVFDFDDDGDLDVFASHMFGLSQLYANDGRGRFQDVTRETLRRTSYGAIGCKAFDYNNDGRLDILIADMHSDMWMKFDDPEVVEPTKKYPYFLGRMPLLEPKAMATEQEVVAQMDIDYGEVLFGNTLLRNEGHGRFTEVSDAAGVETLWPWGVAVGDFNNDGWEDAYLPAGMGYPFFYHPSSLLMNNGDGTFADVATREGIEPPRDGTFLDERIGFRPAARSSRCAATADFDGDGRLDLVVNNFNDRPYFFQNQFAERNYIEFRLTGTTSNRDAIGALVRVHCGREQMVRQVNCAGGYLSQSTKTLHFGLGGHEQIDRVEIRWPSGATQTIDAPPINRLHQLTEPTRP